MVPVIISRGTKGPAEQLLCHVVLANRTRVLWADSATRHSRQQYHRKKRGAQRRPFLFHENTQCLPVTTCREKAPFEKPRRAGIHVTFRTGLSLQGIEINQRRGCSAFVIHPHHSYHERYSAIGGFHSLFQSRHGLSEEPHVQVACTL